VTPEAVAVLRLYQKATRASVKKYNAVDKGIGEGDRLRNTFQFAGASRTNRWAGRRFQPTNLTRTPKSLENVLHEATDAIRNGDDDYLDVLIGEPMDALAGCLRSAIRAQNGYELRACDLNAIETRVIGWLAGCEKLLDVFRQGLDPYKAFAVYLFDVPYEQVTRTQRNDSKPPTLGCGFGLSAGEQVGDKKTGLLGYADKMGIPFTPEFAKRAVRIYRETYAEVPQFWNAIGDAARVCVKTGKTQEINQWLRFERRGSYLALRLPSGRYIYYLHPKMLTTWWAKHPYTGAIKSLGPDEPRAQRAKAKGWEVFDRLSLTYMGKPQNKTGWERVITHPAKVCENAVQAVARDVLKEGMLRADADGFNIVLHVYDEICCEERITDRYHSVERLAEHMSAPIDWAPGLPLGAAGWSGPFYKKD